MQCQHEQRPPSIAPRLEQVVALDPRLEASPFDRIGTHRSRCTMTSRMILALASILAGAIASVVRLWHRQHLTPLLRARPGEARSAAVSIPHLAGTALRFWKLPGTSVGQLSKASRASAAGGLAGALLNSAASNRALELTLGSSGIRWIDGDHRSRRPDALRPPMARSPAPSPVCWAACRNRAEYGPAALGIRSFERILRRHRDRHSLIIRRADAGLSGHMGGEIAAIGRECADRRRGAGVGDACRPAILAYPRARIPPRRVRLILALGISMLAR